MRILTELMVLFDTTGRQKLLALGIGPSEIARRLGAAPGGKPISPSTVSRWLSGHSRPDRIYLPRLAAFVGTADADWLTAEERASVDEGIRALESASNG